MLAQKVWDDTPLINADFSILYPALTVKEINFLERKFLDLLEFKVYMPPLTSCLLKCLPLQKRGGEGPGIGGGGVQSAKPLVRLGLTL